VLGGGQFFEDSAEKADLLEAKRNLVAEGKGCQSQFSSVSLTKKNED
jgi:hypothetical protein